GGEARVISGVADGEFPLRFSPDGRLLYLWKRGDVPARVTRLDLQTGRSEVWKNLIPADPAGVERISNVLVTPDGKSYAYGFTPPDTRSATVNLSMSFFRPTRGDRVVAEARLIRAGLNLVFAAAEIIDAEGRVTARCDGTCAIALGKSDSQEISDRMRGGGVVP